MLSEGFLDIAVLVCLLVGMLGTWKVFRSMRRTPTNWVGERGEFEKRIAVEGKWGSVAWIFLVLAGLIAVIDVIVN